MHIKNVTIFFDLIKSSLLNIDFSKKDVSLTENDISELFDLAKKHDLSHLVAHSFYKNSVIPKEEFYKKKLDHYQLNALYRSEKRRYTYNLLCDLFEKNAIPYVPLKGIVTSEFYPESWMRTSGDIDILLKESDVSKVIELLKNSGWTMETKPAYKDYSLFFTNGVHLELHFSIKETLYALDKVLDKVWGNVEKCEGFKFKMFQTNEFYMFHLLAHMAYHFINGGCGIRFFIDIWILRNKLIFDEEVLRALCKEAQIEEFYDNVLNLINVWFNGENRTEKISEMEKYILEGGVFGIITNRVAIQQVISGGKIKNVMQRLFMPYETLVIKYPALKGKIALTPFFQVRRWFEIFKKNKFNESVNELKTNTYLSEDEVTDMAKLLTDVGLYHII